MASIDLRQDDFIDWLTRSGMQCSSGPDRGGVWGWIDERSNRGSFLYTESTGYLLTLLLNLSAGDPGRNARSAALSAANWIESVAMTTDGFVLARKYADGDGAEDPFEFGHGIAVLFDSCIAAYGLINAYRLTGDATHADAALAIGERCLSAFFDSDLQLRNALYDTTSSAVVPPGKIWSRQSGSFNLKAAMLFAELGNLTGDTKFRRSVDGLIRNALDRQAEDGRFVTCDVTQNTHLHPHCYTLEGLLFLSQRLSRRDLFERAVEGVDFIFRTCLRSTTNVSQSWPNDDDYCQASLRSDVIAQSLRLHYLIKLIDPDTSYAWEAKLPDLHGLMDSFVLESGGTSYGRDARGELIEHSNSWSQFFRIEMKLLRDRQEKGLGFPAGDIAIT